MVLLYELTPFTYGREEDPPPQCQGGVGGYGHCWECQGLREAQVSSHTYYPCLWGETASGICS